MSNSAFMCFAGLAWFGYWIIRGLQHFGIWSEVVPGMRPFLAMFIGMGLGALALWLANR